MLTEGQPSTAMINQAAALLTRQARPLRVGIYTVDALTYKHGTGAQVLRILENSELEFFHFYSGWAHGALSDCPNSYHLALKSAWKSRRGIHRALSLLG